MNRDARKSGPHIVAVIGGLLDEDMLEGDFLAVYQFTCCSTLERASGVRRRACGTVDTSS
jgi:hypothetical protein